jgi:hypothetical protein
MVTANAIVSAPLDAFGNLIRRNNSTPNKTTVVNASHGSEGAVMHLDVARMHLKKSGK